MVLHSLSQEEGGGWGRDRCCPGQVTCHHYHQRPGRGQTASAGGCRLTSPTLILAVDSPTEIKVAFARLGNGRAFGFLACVQQVPSRGNGRETSGSLGRKREQLYLSGSSHLSSLPFHQPFCWLCVSNTGSGILQSSCF